VVSRRRPDISRYVADADGLWLIGHDGFTPFKRWLVPDEDFLQERIEAEPCILSDLLIVGREVLTDGHGFIDLLAVDAVGNVWVIELKKGAAPRKIMDQVIGYSAWARSLDLRALSRVFADYSEGESFDEAFQKRFGQPFPAGGVAGRVVAIVAASIDEHAHCQLYELEATGMQIQAYCYEYLFAGPVEAIRLRRASFTPHTPQQDSFADQPPDCGDS
jgi:hypothetical protein